MVVGKSDKAAISGGKIDYQSGVTFLINKPIEWTSFDVVRKLRNAIKRKLNVKKIKVGHAGTLDPLAEGLLIICVGRDTKKISEFQEMPKVYKGRMKLGAVTKTYDSEMEEENVHNVAHLKEEEIMKAVEGFTGEIHQKPPIYSALKRQGKRLYDIARKGQTVTLPIRAVTVYNFEIESIQMPEIDFEVKCSKGTYIRSLAHDLGQELGVGGYLLSLSREAIGPYKREDAFEINDVAQLIQDEESTT